uniref:GCM domain-containing protein n=1 Tax=Macrostomum lignano TaxID=282301 RepID=A0A1I8GP91_9PLAT
AVRKADCRFRRINTTVSWRWRHNRRRATTVGATTGRRNASTTTAPKAPYLAFWGGGGRTFDSCRTQCQSMGYADLVSYDNRMAAPPCLTNFSVYLIGARYNTSDSKYQWGQRRGQPDPQPVRLGSAANTSVHCVTVDRTPPYSMRSVDCATPVEAVICELVETVASAPEGLSGPSSHAETCGNCPLPSQALSPLVTPAPWQPQVPDSFQLWPDGACRYAYGGRQDEAKRHTSAGRCGTPTITIILKKSCLGVLVCSRGCLAPSGNPLALRPAICDKARRKQCGKPCPNAKCDGTLVLQACRGHSGYPVTHFWRHLNGCVYFQAKGAHDHPAPDLKPAEDIRRRMRLLKKSGVPAVVQRREQVQHQFAQQQQPIVKKAKKPQRQQQQPQHQQVQRQQQLIVKNAPMATARPPTTSMAGLRRHDRCSWDDL